MANSDRKGATPHRETQSSPWWSAGVRFSCQGSGKCCISRGAYGFVYLTLEDRRRLAAFLNLKTQAFTRRYCQKTEGLYHLREEKGRTKCLFLKDTRCGVYSARPLQCRTWPFWPENMNAKAWDKEVRSFCPGVGRGRVVPADEIEANLREQMISSSRLFSE